MIAGMFKVSKGSIYDHYHNFQAHQNDPGTIGRPPILNAMPSDPKKNLRR
jgi:hypothetical protein